MTWTRLVVGLGLLASTGCYGYKTVPAARPGMEVRASLKTEAAVRRSQGLDEPVMRLSGRVVDTTAEWMSIDVLVARSSSAFQEIEIRDTVRLEVSEIQSLAERRISPGKTALATVLAGVAAFAAVKGIDQIVGGTSDEPDPGDTTFRSPFLSIRLFRFR